MDTDKSPIRWFSLFPSELRGVSFEELTERYRGITVAGLVTHLESLNGTVIILLSPIGFMFSRAASLDVLRWHNHGDINWGGNLERNRAYARELRKSRIGQKTPQARLFGNFDRECRKSNRNVPSLSTSIDYLESVRLSSYGFEDDYEASVIKYLGRLFGQLSGEAFFAIPENLNYHDLKISDLHTINFSHLIMNWTYPMISLTEENLGDAMGAKVLDALKRNVQSLENDPTYDIHFEPRMKAFGSLTLLCINVHPLTAEILSYRCRLIRLLKFPTFCPQVQAQLPRVREQWPALAADKTLIYDPIAELEAYLAEILGRYPAFGENPFVHTITHISYQVA